MIAANAFNPFTSMAAMASGGRHPLAPTGQTKCYSGAAEILPPQKGERFFGQDAQHMDRNQVFNKNDDGTVTDPSTGLQWTSSPDQKAAWEDAVRGASLCRAAGHSDWRLPNIKELASLLDFAGIDAGPESGGRPFINTRAFVVLFGGAGRNFEHDGLYWSSTLYQGRIMGSLAAFGVNFRNGRIKACPIGPFGWSRHGRPLMASTLYVRGVEDYGQSRYVEGPEGTVVDEATGLMWALRDSGAALSWTDALAYAERRNLAGHTDWRLPNAKELQALVDYSRSPSSTHSAAIHPLFKASRLGSEDGSLRFGSCWTATTHLTSAFGASMAAIVHFGEALGWVQIPGEPEMQVMDVHGAGAMRADFKEGNPLDYPRGLGPQGDVVRMKHLVRLVRSA